MLNRILLIGRLGRDPETRYTGGGQAVCNFSIAVGEKWTSKSGEKKERTEWFSCQAWGKLAEICQKFLTKGALVYVSGKMQKREWQDRDGAKHVAWDAVISEMRMLEGKKDNGQPAAGEEEAAEPVPDDEIPF